MKEKSSPSSEDEERAKSSLLSQIISKVFVYSIFKTIDTSCINNLSW